MEPLVKKQLIESVKNIKNKLKQMQQDEDDLELTQKKIFKPIIDPLKAIASLNSLSENNNITREKSAKCVTEKNIEESFNEECGDHDEKNISVDEFKTPSKKIEKIVKVLTPKPLIKDKVDNIKKNINIPFGVRTVGEQMLIGNTPITFPVNTTPDIPMMTIDSKTYEMTSGLTELLFESRPNSDVIAEKDKLMYKDILIRTNAHKRGFSPSGQIQGNSGLKYCKIVKPLFYEPETGTEKHGGNLPTLKKYASNIDLVYWDDPNELIDRLKIIIASKDAGNSGHDNEIISIIEELKEAGIIKE